MVKRIEILIPLNEKYYFKVYEAGTGVYTDTSGEALHTLADIVAARDLAEKAGLCIGWRLTSNGKNLAKLIS